MCQPGLNMPPGHIACGEGTKGGPLPIVKSLGINGSPIDSLVTPGWLKRVGSKIGALSLTKGVPSLLVKGVKSSDDAFDVACGGPRGELGALGGVASISPASERGWVPLPVEGDTLWLPAPLAEPLFVRRSAARLARAMAFVAVRQATAFACVALCRSSLGRTFRPDMSMLEGDTLTFEGMIEPSGLSVMDEGRAE